MSGVVPLLPVFAFIAWKGKTFPLNETLTNYVTFNKDSSYPKLCCLNMFTHCDDSLIPCTLNKNFYSLFTFFKLVLSKNSTLFPIFLHQFGLFGKPEGKRPLGRPKRRWDDNMKMDLQEVGGGRGDWMELAQDRDKWRALVGTVRDFRVS